MDIDLEIVKKELKKLAKDTHNLERKCVRRAISKAYSESWMVFHKSYPFIKKNARTSEGTRSFRERTKSFLSLKNYPMFGEFKTEARSITAIYDVLGPKIPYPQKGVSFHERQKIRFRKSSRLQGSKAFMAKIKGNTFLFRNAGGRKIKKEALPSVSLCLFSRIGAIEVSAYNEALKTMNEIM